MPPDPVPPAPVPPDPVPPDPGPTGDTVDAYRGAQVAFGTRHGKERLAAPAFRAVLGAEVTAPPDLDTDRFGTFSGELPRLLSPLDAARAKARLALAATGRTLALASEATFGPLPGLGFPGHEELLLFVDELRGLEIVEGHRVLGVPGPRRTVRRVEELEDDLAGSGWPDQALVVLPAGADASAATVVKGIADRDTLAAAVVAAVSSSPTGAALVEPDLRAQHCPARRAVLRDLADRLARRLATGCPSCAAPGFGRTDVERGLPCRACGTATELVRADVHGCGACGHRRTAPRAESHADPRWCGDCNP